VHLLPDPHKEKARRAKDAFENVRDWAGYMALVMAEKDPRYSVMSASLAVASGWSARQAARIADDPPRTDFAEEVVRRRRRFHLAEVEHDELTEVGVELIDAMLETDGDLAAMLVATERIAGGIMFAEGLLPSEQDVISVEIFKRRREAYLFARKAGDNLLHGAEVGQRFAGLHRTIDRPRRGERGPFQPRYRLADELPDRAMASLYRAGVPIGRLRDTFRLPGAVGSSYAETLEEASDTAASYGTYLVEETGRGALVLDPRT
jgi:hypothetical protein